MPRKTGNAVEDNFDSWLLRWINKNDTAVRAAGLLILFAVVFTLFGVLLCQIGRA